MNLAKEFKHDFEKSDFRLFNIHKDEIYFENYFGYWEKSLFDKAYTLIYFENSKGFTEGIELKKIDGTLSIAQKFHHNFNDGIFRLFDENENEIYYEENGYWEKFIFNEDDKVIYYETLLGYWEKYRYNAVGNKIYFENSHGVWLKWEHDKDGNQTYYGTSDGYWESCEYDSNGKRIYYEDSEGYVFGLKSFDSEI